MIHFNGLNIFSFISFSHVLLYTCSAITPRIIYPKLLYIQLFLALRLLLEMVVYSEGQFFCPKEKIYEPSTDPNPLLWSNKSSMVISSFILSVGNSRCGICFEGLSLTDSLFSVFAIPIKADVKALVLLPIPNSVLEVTGSLFSRSRYPKPLEKILYLF